MSDISNLILNNLEGILEATVSGLLVIVISRIVVIVRKRFFSKPLSEPKEQAVKLNAPLKSIEENCSGRDKILEKISKRITDKENLSFIKKNIAITGEEGIGKTVVCYTLFKTLRKYLIFLGWIECNGKQSVFDIISNTFEDLRFCGKGKEDILKAFADLGRPCVLFVDQIDQYTPLDEIEEISRCANVILILSGLIRKIHFVNYTFILPPLSDKDARLIFEQQAKEEIKSNTERKSINALLEDFAKGNPFLIRSFAKAKHRYGDSWENVLKKMQTSEYEANDYLYNICRKLYKVNELKKEQQTALTRLSVIQYQNFTKSVFDLLDISDYCVNALCNTYWLEQNDSIMYTMDEIHCKVISKLFENERNLTDAIYSINEYISEKSEKSNVFRCIALYIEGLLKRVQGFATQIMEKSIFFDFAYNVAVNYHYISNYKKCLEWAALCKSKDENLLYCTACIEFQGKYRLVNKIYSPSEVEQAYSDALEKAKRTADFENHKKFLLQEYCNFLICNHQYNEAILLCKEYFEISSMDFKDKNNCDMFHRYLCVAQRLDDQEALEWLANEKTIQGLYLNENVSITVAWSFGKLYEIYTKQGDKENADLCLRNMVVLLNEKKGFFNEDIKIFLKVSDMEFAEYMHSCDELLESLNGALGREDAEALYIEGRYQEEQENYDTAFSLYEIAAKRDSLRGMCSLALLYYRGQGEARNYDKAREYWEYCRERGHSGSCYWLGVLLLDTNYKYHDKEKALKYITEAAESGSERAKQKLRLL